MQNRMQAHDTLRCIEWYDIWAYWGFDLCVGDVMRVLCFNRSIQARPVTERLE